MSSLREIKRRAKAVKLDTGCALCDRQWKVEDGQHKFMGRRKDTGALEPVNTPCSR